MQAKRSLPGFARFTRFAWVFTLATLLALTLPLRAMSQDLASPKGEVLLTISGAVVNTNDGFEAKFDRAMLEALEKVEFETTTIWTDGVQTFTGVPLATLMEVVGARGDVLMATAINDYGVEIPRSDWVKGGPIVAYLRNGQEMSVRTKGPLWIVYPYDTNTAYQGEITYARSIWQLNRIEVK